MGLSESFLGKPPTELSGEQKQRVAIAAMLALQPDIIVLDEPTTGQDHAMCEEIMVLLDGLHRAGHTIVIITHDMQLVAEHCRRALVMADGKVIADGPPASVFSDARVMLQAHLEPPQATRLALELAAGAVPALSVPELARRLGARPEPAALAAIRLQTATPGGDQVG